MDNNSPLLERIMDEVKETSKAARATEREVIKLGADFRSHAKETHRRLVAVENDSDKMKVRLNSLPAPATPKNGTLGKVPVNAILVIALVVLIAVLAGVTIQYRGLEIIPRDSSTTPSNPSDP